MLVNDFLGADVIRPFQGQTRSRLVSFSEIDYLQLVDDPRRLPLTKSGWDEADAVPGSSAVKVCVGSAALRELSLEIFDLEPAKESLSSDEGWAQVQSCHGVVSAVDATSGITRTELDLLYEIAMRTGPPILGVIITGIVKVEENERLDVVAAVRRGLASRHLAGVPTLTAPVGSQGGGLFRSVVVQGQARLRARGGDDWLTMMGVVLWAEQLIAALRDRQVALSLSVDERRHELAVFEHNWRAETQQWTLAKLEVREQSADFSARLRRDIMEDAEKLASSLVDRYRQAPATDTYWLTDEMPQALNQGLTDIAKHCEGRVGEHIAAQVTSLRAPLADGTLHEPPMLPVPEVGDVVPPAAVLPMRRLDRIRLLLNLSNATLSVLVPVLAWAAGLPPITPAPITSELTARYIEAQSRDVRKIGEELIRSQVGRASGEFAGSVTRAVDEFTAGLIAEGERTLTRRLDDARRALTEHPTNGYMHTLADLEAQLKAGLTEMRRTM